MPAGPSNLNHGLFSLGYLAMERQPTQSSYFRSTCLGVRSRRARTSDASLQRRHAACQPLPRFRDTWNKLPPEGAKEGRLHG